jgi:hypothetical protein
MDDTSSCPICNAILRSTKHYEFLYATNKSGKYVERICRDAPNHLFQIYYDESTSQVDFLKLSLSPVYSRWVEIDFHNKRSRIIIYNGYERQYIDIPRTLEPDFPQLTELKSKVSLYTLLS